MTETKILVVDDHPIHRRMLADELQGLGYEVRRAKDIATADDTLRRFEPDLVLADLVLRGNRHEMLDWIQSLRRDDRYAKLKVLFVTAHHEAMQKSVADIPESSLLPKPFTFEQVHLAIKTLMKPK